MELSVGASSWAPPSSSTFLPCRRHRNSSNIRSGNWRMIGWHGNQAKRSCNVKRSLAALLPEVPISRSVPLKRQFPLQGCAGSDGLSLDTELDDIDVGEENTKVSREKHSVDDNMSIPPERPEGKPGFISFHGRPYQALTEVLPPILNKGPTNYLWFVGPTVLVASFILPSLYMRRLVLIVFEDSLLTDFLILFFTEALFYGGVAMFVLLIDHVWQPAHLAVAKKIYHPHYQFGLRVSSVAVLVLSLVIPLVTMGMVWPWMGPAASATLAPYLVGLVIQFAFEQYARYRKSTAWPVIPIIFQVYRLHQLNRAAQLVTALSFSVRGAESTSQTMAINNSLGTLLNVLQLLGIICVWSFANFLMRFIPSPISDS